MLVGQSSFSADSAQCSGDALVLLLRGFYHKDVYAPDEDETGPAISLQSLYPENARTFL